VFLKRILLVTVVVLHLSFDLITVIILDEEYDHIEC